MKSLFLKRFITFKQHLSTSSIICSTTRLPKGLYTFQESHKEFQKSTEEWKFVERILPNKLIPKPEAKPGTVTSSGWISPSASEFDYPYFVCRNQSHLFKLYKNTHQIFPRVMTTLKGVEGDIFLLGNELREYLLNITEKRTVLLRVNEPHGTIIVHGDYFTPIEKFLLDKGF